MSRTAPIMKVAKQTFGLVDNQQLVLEQTPFVNVLTILAPDGRVSLCIHITSDGPVLHFESGRLTLEARGILTVDAERIAIHGREGVAITSGGDAKICAAGDLDSQARIQNITAHLGNVNVRANDDVRLNGERVMMNCDAEPPQTPMK